MCGAKVMSYKEVIYEMVQVEARWCLRWFLRWASYQYDYGYDYGYDYDCNYDWVIMTIESHLGETIQDQNTY